MSAKIIQCLQATAYYFPSTGKYIYLRIRSNCDVTCRYYKQTFAADESTLPNLFVLEKPSAALYIKIVNISSDSLLNQLMFVTFNCINYFLS